VVAKVKELLSVSKKAVQTFDVERCNPRKLRELEVRKQYQVKISNRITVLEKLNDSEDKNRAWENIKENIKTSVEDSLGQHELKQQKPWFAEECLRFLDQMKQAKMQNNDITPGTFQENIYDNLSLTNSALFNC
jgi:CRISPR/Cas system-associated protein Cas5 (RAMP superfamily)